MAGHDVFGGAMKAKSRLQEARLSRGWKQGDLIDALVAAAQRLRVEAPSPASWKTLISMYENGRRPVSADHQPLFREAYQATNEELGFPELGILLDVRAPRPSAPSLRTKIPIPISPEMLGYLTSLLDQHAQAEPLVGPQFLVAPVQSQMPLIEQMCRDAYGPLRGDVLRISARYAEFLGWLHQDTGHADEAMRWTSTAMEYAQELGDPTLIAYLFQRRSNIDTEAGHAGHGAGLASAALRYAAQLSPRVHAVVLRQLANSKAGLGEDIETDRAIGQALAAAELQRAPGTPGRGCGDLPGEPQPLADRAGTGPRPLPRSPRHGQRPSRGCGRGLSGWRGSNGHRPTDRLGTHPERAIPPATPSCKVAEAGGSFGVQQGAGHNEERRPVNRSEGVS